MTKKKNIILDLVIFLSAGVLLSSAITVIVTLIAGIGLNIERIDDLIWMLAFYTLPSIVISGIVFVVASLRGATAITVYSYLLIYSIAYAVSLSVPYATVKLNNLLSNSMGGLGFLIILLTSLPFVASLLFALGILVFKRIFKKA